ncbi:MAG: RNA methyltransferase [Pseudomonadota bacterium]
MRKTAPQSDGRRRRTGARRPETRSEPGPYWLYGLHAVKAALANPQRATGRLIATRNAARDLPSGTEPEILEPKAMSRLLPEGSVHQGLAVEVSPLDPPALETLLDHAGPLLVLDQVTDPHNLGAILRSAAAFGAGAMVTMDRHTPFETGVLAKAASGALEAVPWVRVTNLARALEEQRSAGRFALGLDEAGDPVQGAPLPEKISLVLGAEGKGLRPSVKAACDGLVSLPTQNAFTTLNVSNAAAVALFAVTSGRAEETASS